MTYSGDEYVSFGADSACLDGWFSADDLRQIADMIDKGERKLEPQPTKPSEIWRGDKGCVGRITTDFDVSEAEIEVKFRTPEGHIIPGKAYSHISNTIQVILETNILGTWACNISVVLPDDTRVSQGFQYEVIE